MHHSNISHKHCLIWKCLMLFILYAQRYGSRSCLLACRTRACVSPSLSSLILRLLLVFGRRFPKGIVSLLDAIARPYRQIGWIMAGCQQCGWYITTLIGIIYVFCAEECKIVKQRQRDGIVLLLLLLLLPNT